MQVVNCCVVSSLLCQPCCGRLWQNTKSADPDIYGCAHGVGYWVDVVQYGGCFLFWPQFCWLMWCWNMYQRVSLYGMTCLQFLMCCYCSSQPLMLLLSGCAYAIPYAPKHHPLVTATTTVPLCQLQHAWPSIPNTVYSGAHTIMCSDSVTHGSINYTALIPNILKSGKAYVCIPIQ